jgi:hypothetical protein
MEEIVKPICVSTYRNFACGPLLLSALIVALAAEGCARPEDDLGVGGALEIALTIAPADVACLRVTVQGSRSQTRLVDLAPGAETVFSLSKLPIGPAIVDGEAFAARCNAVGRSTAPSFVSEAPVQVRIDPRSVARVLLKLIRNGRLSVGVDFENSYEPRLYKATEGGPKQTPPYLMNPRSVILKREIKQEEVRCPRIKGWKERLLFEEKSSGPHEVHCGYRWVADGDPAYETLNVVPRKSAACDQPIMAAMSGEVIPGPELPPATWTSLQSIYRQRVRHVTNLAALQPARVQVAVIDSAVFPYDAPNRERYPHGRAIGRVIADLACPVPGGRDCADRIRNYLALDICTLEGEPDRTLGGYFGDYQTLADQIHLALDDWEKELTPGKPSDPLVINLSLGWDARHPFFLKTFVNDCTSRTANNDATLLDDAVKDALKRASCMGALVVAAAGNADLPGFDETAIYPARWETEAAPDIEACAPFLPPGWVRGVRDQGDALSAYRPLVYAATGVGDNDTILGNTRLNGVARLAGQALGVVTGEPRPAGPAHTALLSGSSLGAATMSGIAAAAWSFNPSASPHEVMRWLHETRRAAFVYSNTGGGDLPEFPVADVLLCPAGPCPREFTGVVQHCDAVARARGTRAGLACEPPYAGIPAIPPGPGGSVSETAPSAPSPPDIATLAEPIFGSHYAPWVRPAPEPFGCLPGYCMVDLNNGLGGLLQGFFFGRFDSGASFGTIQYTYLTTYRLFNPIPDTRLIFTPSNVPGNGVNFEVFIPQSMDLSTNTGTIFNWVWTPSGWIAHAEPVVVKVVIY